jgi:hypothetical protein
VQSNGDVRAVGPIQVSRALGKNQEKAEEFHFQCQWIVLGEEPNDWFWSVIAIARNPSRALSHDWLARLYGYVLR